ncbi:glutaredoxin family protein [Alicyclobacillus mengziensis]|uniref:Glutaredoxin family protein n=1 Tax=Alicyclobacillus mengziensis TaxID=2931921 RepID=A0A9X7VZ70_9BACL|nr:glutaredoxin family protein [Alicyclobacillus mengziensis]QSO46403.1 glutaredoxin family protein [Alicyclobacillus mengziensis]
MSSKVIMYVIPICPYCRQAKNFLRQRGIPFEERNILFHRKYRQEFEHLTTVMTVPVTTFDGQVVIGYDKTKFERALKNMAEQQQTKETI